MCACGASDKVLKTSAGPDSGASFGSCGENSVDDDGVGGVVVGGVVVGGLRRGGFCALGAADFGPPPLLATGGRGGMEEDDDVGPHDEALFVVLHGGPGGALRF